MTSSQQQQPPQKLHLTFEQLLLDREKSVLRDEESLEFGIINPPALSKDTEICGDEVRILDSEH